MRMDIPDQFGDLDFENADLLDSSLIKGKEAAQFRVKDRVVNTNCIGREGLERKELLRRELST